MKAYYVTIVIKNQDSVWYQRRERHTDQDNRRDITEIDPQKYTQLIFDNDAKAI